MSNPINSIKFLVLIVFFCISQNVIAQDYIEGKVFKASDSTAVNGASIYFDGTTVGTVSNSLGAFKIPYKENNALLVISYLSTETTYINLNTDNYKGEKLNIYLNDKLEELTEVTLETDTWSREKKLRIFKRQFIGPAITWSSCKILNEDDIRLKYIPSSKILVASARTPLIIKNKELGYTITYNLTDFEVSFEKTRSGLTLPYKVYLEGSSFFEPLKKRTSKKMIKNRAKSYLGSSLHFFRALASKTLEENKFEIYYKSFKVAPYQYINVINSGTRKSIELKAENLNILYDGYSQSNMNANSVFYIDEYGNHSPPDAVLMGGDMGEKRISDLLPLDYKYIIE